ncbi:MAG TPA: hypothetical protein DDZ99_05280 [Clostridiales bacterium]|nr:hypothetical protein [Clostridiales bacterium]
MLLLPDIFKCPKSLKYLTLQFYEWVLQQSKKTLPKSLWGTALHYATNQRKYLCSFLEDGRIELFNNRAERSIKPFVIGRKNWLFCNAPAGAKSSAVIYNIIETAKENGLIPYAYLTYVFEQIQLHRNQNIENLFPYSPIIPKYCRIKSEKKH